MAINASQRADIVQVAVSLFGIAPGGYMDELVSIYNETGQTTSALAAVLGTTPAFQDQFPSHLTNEEIAKVMAANLGLDGTDAASTQAYDFFLAGVQAGSDKAALLLEASNYIASSTDESFAEAKALLSNKVAVAEYYTVEQGGTSKDVAALASVLSNVEAGSDTSSSAAIEDLIDPSAPAETDGKTFTLTAGTDRGVDFVGTVNGDTFEAFLVQNSWAGGVSNSLSSADKLDGGSGADSLFAELVPEFFGVTGDNQVDVQPATKNIESVLFEARDGGSADANNGITITVDAKNMTDIDSIGSKFSDGDLVIENLTTLESNGNIRNTESITVVMDHTDNFNSDTDASDLTVYFDEDYLVSGMTESSNSIDYRVMNQDAFDLIQEGKQNVELLDGVTFERLNFELNGTTYELAPLIGSADDATGTAIRTHQQLVDAMNTAIAELGLTDKVTAVLAENFVEETAQGQAESRTAPIVRLEGAEGEELSANENLVYLAPSDQNPTTADGTVVQNSNRYDRAEVSSTLAQSKPVAVNVEVEKVGRDGEGGNLIIGGKDQNLNGDSDVDQTDGIAVFNVGVRGTNDQPSNLGFVSSTNQALTTVNIANATGWDGADLTIRDAFNGNTVNTTNATNVETVNANSFSGDLSIGSASAMMNVDTFTATGGGAISVNASIDGTEKGSFSYTTGGAADKVTIALDGDAVDQTATSFTANTNSGNDTVSITMDSVDLTTAPDVSFQTMQALDNLVVNTGSGDDKVDLNAYGTFQINAGDGSDFVVVNSTDQNGDAAKGMWTFGQDTGAQVFGDRVLYNAKLQVSFAGFEQTVDIATDASGNYIANQLTINEAIKSAIAANPELARLLAVESDAVSAAAGGSDTSSTGAQELVITSTVGGLNDLRVQISQPTLSTNDLASADVTALRQGIIDTTAITSTALGDTAAIVAEMGNANFGNGATGIFAGNVGVNGVVGTDYTAYSTGGTTDDATAINFSTINMGTGTNDLVVLHSNDNSANVLEVTSAFGKVSVVNFFDNTISQTGGANLTVGNHLLDFTSILDNKVDVSIGNSNTQSAVAIANTVNKDATAEANSVSVLSFADDAANANAVNWNSLNATNLVDAINGKAGAAILGTGTITGASLSAATTTAGGDLIGSTHKHVVMVENANNPGEYKVFSLTSGATSAAFNEDGTLLGTLDFGYSIGNNFGLAGDAVSTAGMLVNSTVAALEKNSDALINGTLTDAAGNAINEFNVDIVDGSAPATPTYALTADAAAADEGATATFTLATTNVTAGSVVNYTLSGVNAADVTGGALTGTATVDAAGNAAISVALAADATTEGAETLTVTIDGTTATASTTVNDTSVTPGDAITVTAAGAAGTAAADTFAVDAVTALADAAGTNFQAMITNFDVAADKLSIDLATADASITNLAELNGQQGVSVNLDPFAHTAVINLGADANGGEVVTITLTGTVDITDLAAIAVDVI